MRGFQPRSAAGAQEQRFADGGFVQGIKRAFGMDEERNAQIAAYRARAAAEKAQQQAQAQQQTPQPQQRAVTEYSGMSALQRREKELGLADGGRVRPRGFVAGKGTATSDSIPARLSNGEYVLPADTVRAVGVEALDALRESTHQPVKGEQPKAARGFFAGGTPGGVGTWFQDQQREQEPRKQEALDAGQAAPDQPANPALAAPAPSSPPSAVTKAPLSSLSSRVSQIPTDGPRAPAADGSQDSWLNTETGRNLSNIASAMPGSLGAAIPRVAKTGGAISGGIDSAARLLNAGSGAIVAGYLPDASTAQAATTPPASQTNPAAAPASASLANAGRGVVNPPAVNPAAPAPSNAPAAAPEVMPGVYRHGRGQYSDNASGMGLTSVPGSGGQGSPVGKTVEQAQREGLVGERVGYNPAYDQRLNGATGISAQNMAAADALATRQTPAGFQPAGSPQASVQAPIVRNSTNDWAARKALENAATAASSITANGGRFDRNGRAGSPQAAVYRAALANDFALQQAQPGMDQTAMRENAANQRVAMQEQGANTRDAGRNALTAEELALRREAQGFQTREAQQKEQLRNVLLDQKATPEQRAMAQRSLAALSGKTAADRMQTVTLPDTTNEMGQVVRGGQALVRVLEDGSVQQVPIGAQQGAALPPGMKRQIGTSNGRPVYEDMNGKQVIAKG